MMKAPLNQDYKKLREEMVEKAIFARGVRSELVLDGFINYNGHLEIHNSLLGVLLADQPRTVSPRGDISNDQLIGLNVRPLRVVFAADLSRPNSR
jgi:hypothetical protein